MTNKKVSIDLDIEDLLNLTEPNKDSLEYDLNFIIENGIDKYIENQQKHEDEKRKFIELFKECFDDLCVFMEKDPQQRIAVNCFTCIKGMDLSKQYGKPKKR